MRSEPLPPLVQGFFNDFLITQRNASRNTILAYRDSLKLLLCFAADRTHRDVTGLRVGDVDVETVLAFLDHIERERRCSIATRNVRLAAIRTFFRYVARRQPAASEFCRCVVDIPSKKRNIKTPAHLECDELDAILAAADRQTAVGRRDCALLWLLYDTGARVQEIVDLNVPALRLSPPEQVRLLGKGRKERICPIAPETAALVRTYLDERGVSLDANVPLFTNRLGTRLTRTGIARRIKRYAWFASASMPTLGDRRISPHTMRHTTAMHLLQSGTDLRVISAMLGHASMLTTHHYARIDLEMKRKALAATTRGTSKTRSKRPPSWRRQPTLLEWLERL